MYAQMVNLSCCYPVSRRDIVTALKCLARKHPLLRMNVRERKDTLGAEDRFYFQEMDNFEVKLYEVCGADYDSILMKETKSKFDVEWTSVEVYSRVEQQVTK